MSAINLISPIARMPFGPEKGTPIWAISINTIVWLKKQELTPETHEVLEDAWDMFMHEGQYAVLQLGANRAERTKLIGIRKTFTEAFHLSDAGKGEFVYTISQPVAERYSSL